MFFYSLGVRSVLSIRLLSSLFVQVGCLDLPSFPFLSFCLYSLCLYFLCLTLSASLSLSLSFCLSLSLYLSLYLSLCLSLSLPLSLSASLSLCLSLSLPFSLSLSASLWLSLPLDDDDDDDEPAWSSLLLSSSPAVPSPPLRLGPTCKPPKKRGLTSPPGSLSERANSLVESAVQLVRACGAVEGAYAFCYLLVPDLSCYWGCPRKPRGKKPLPRALTQAPGQARSLRPVPLRTWRPFLDCACVWGEMGKLNSKHHVSACSGKKFNHTAHGSTH